MVDRVSFNREVSSKTLYSLFPAADDDENHQLHPVTAVLEKEETGQNFFYSLRENHLFSLMKKSL